MLNRTSLNLLEKDLTAINEATTLEKEQALKRIIDGLKDADLDYIRRFKLAIQQKKMRPL